MHADERIRRRASENDGSREPTQANYCFAASWKSGMDGAGRDRAWRFGEWEAWMLAGSITGACSGGWMDSFLLLYASRVTALLLKTKFRQTEV